MAGRALICSLVVLTVVSAPVSAYVLPYRRCLLHKGMGMHRHVPVAVRPKPASRPFTLADLPQPGPIFITTGAALNNGLVAVGDGFMDSGISVLEPGFGDRFEPIGSAGVGSVGVGNVGVGSVGVGVGAGPALGAVHYGLDDRTQFSSRLPRRKISDSTVIINRNGLVGASKHNGNLPSQISDSTVVISGPGVNSNTLANSGIDISDSTVHYENTGPAGFGSAGYVAAPVNYVSGGPGVNSNNLANSGIDISDSTVRYENTGPGVNSNILANRGIDISDSTVRYVNTGTAGFGSAGHVAAPVNYISGGGVAAGGVTLY